MRLFGAAQVEQYADERGPPRLVQGLKSHAAQRQPRSDVEMTAIDGGK